MKQETKPVEIQLPVVKLRVEDLSWLLGMANETTEIKCSVPHKNLDRMLVLGLVENYEMPPCPTRMKEFHERRRIAEEKLRKAVKPKSIDWDIVSNLQVSYTGDRNAPANRTGVRITSAGRTLIKNGIAKVQISKSCK